MNSPKPTAPQSTVGGIPVPLPNEEELAPHSLSDYAKNNPPEWIESNFDVTEFGQAWGLIELYVRIGLIIFIFILFRIAEGIDWSSWMW